MASVVEAYWDAARRLCDHYGHDAAEEMLEQAKRLARLDGVLSPADLYKLGVMLREPRWLRRVRGHHVVRDRAPSGSRGAERLKPR